MRPGVGERAHRLGQQVAGLRHQAAGERARGGERDLLAEHGPYGKLGAVDGARHAQVRPGGDQRSEERVAREVRVGGGGVEHR